MEKTILLVDDEDFLRERMVRAFADRGFNVLEAPGCDEGVRLIEQYRPAMAVVDLKMPGKSGLELIREAKKINPQMRIVVLTGYGSIATATEAVKLGALYYLPKPADVDDILNAFGRDPELEIEVNQEEFIPPSLARAEWEHIQRVLADCDDNISEAARRLGIHRRTLQRKLFKYAPRE